MCGIAGIISHDPSMVHEIRLKKMMDTLAHRGPDGEGTWINGNGNIGFGHRRLSIIDLSSRAAQPMHYLNRYSIVYNGEIYNYPELKLGLLKKGYSFLSESDTEVILAMYAEYKEKCIPFFDGMFAFAIWDEQEQTLFAARDRFGEKPFFYHWDDDTKTLCFASEMKALWAIGIHRSVDGKMLLPFLTSGFTQHPSNPALTFFTGIKKLPARNCLVYLHHKSQVSTAPYWEPSVQRNDHITEQEAISKFSDLFFTSVARRLRSDVPLGTSLSGGIDSSSIVAVMYAINSSSKYGADDKMFSSFSAVFPGFEKDESAYIKLVTDKFHLKNFQVIPSVNEFISDFEKLSHFQEEPFTSSSTYAQFKVFELAKMNGVKVLLDGQGADETLAGYAKYYQWYWQELLAKNGISAMREEKKLTTTLTSEVKWGPKNYLAALFPRLASSALSQRGYKLQHVHPDISEEYLSGYAEKAFFAKPVVNSLNDILFFNTFHVGLEELLRLADRNSMAHGREARLPFLNHDLVEFIFSLPSSYKIKQGFTKWILRKSMDKLLPDEILWRGEKIGYEPPQKTWMMDKHLAEAIYSAKKKLVWNGVLNKASLEKKVSPKNAYDADNYDWRYLSAAQIL
ncbi:MAG: asparagine synthase (glutamine-hydrolyzing) [Ginsengibacter sp.]